jgi:hypothetical protein
LPAAKEGHPEKGFGIHDQSLDRAFGFVPCDPSETIFFDDDASVGENGFGATRHRQSETFGSLGTKRDMSGETSVHHSLDSRLPVSGKAHHRNREHRFESVIADGSDHRRRPAPSRYAAGCPTRMR